MTQEQAPAAPPIVCIIGKKKSGKTTTTVRVVAELTRRGWKVMTIKHGHAFDVDHEGRDSWRHRHEGGARRVVMASPHEFAIIGDWPDGAAAGPAQIARTFLQDADVVVVEGFKGESLPRIEVFRTAAHDTPWYDASDTAEAAHYLAVATDDRAFAAPFPVFDIDDPLLPQRLADVIEDRIMPRER